MSKLKNAWEDYRNRYRWFFGVWLGGFAIIATLQTLFDKLSLDVNVIGLGGPLWMLGFLITCLRLSFFKCPQCHKYFFNKWWFNNPPAQHCVHCGLKKWDVASVTDEKKQTMIRNADYRT